MTDAEQKELLHKIIDLIADAVEHAEPLFAKRRAMLRGEVPEHLVASS